MKTFCKVCKKELSHPYNFYCQKHKIFTEQHKKNMSLGKTKDKVGYRAIHYWIERELGKPTKCEDCLMEFSGHKIHWANISGEYKRDIKDWKRLCSSCHGYFDKISREHKKLLSKEKLL